MEPPASTWVGLMLDNQALATFTFTQGALSNYTATINWGDGTNSPGTISAGSGGGGIVSGNHAYAAQGTDVLGVTVTGESTNGSGSTNLPVAYATPSPQVGSYSVLHGRTLTTPAPGVLADTFDVYNLPVTATLSSNVQHGTLSLSSSGTSPTRRLPATSASTRSPTKPSNSHTSSSPTTVIISVYDNAPVAQNDYYTIPHGQSLKSANVLSNDGDPDFGDSLTPSLVTGVQHGTLYFYSNGTFIYTPNAGFIGTDTFTYQDSDGVKQSGIATVTIAVTENPPVAVNDSYSMSHGQTLNVTGTGVLANDSDPDGDSITASLVSSVQHGILLFSPTGAFVYTPAAGFIGTDTFTYQDTDGLETSTVATVSIAVNENPPVAQNDSYSTPHGQVLTTTTTNGVLANDSDPDGDSITASLVSGVQHGTLTFNTNGTFTYTPAAGFIGTDTFTYKDTDGTEWSTVATAIIAVVENAPIAQNDSYSTPHGQTLNAYYGVLSNDSDPDGDSLTASLVSGVQHGTLSFSPSETFTYTSAAGFVGTDFFTYQDTDGVETSTVATVSIAVVENPPIANNDSYSTPHGQTLTESFSYYGVLGNDTDPRA